MKNLLLVAFLAGTFGLMGPAQPPAGEKPAGPAEAKKAVMLDKLKALAGEWEMTSEGKTSVAIVSKVTSAGSVYCETMFPGSEHEMTNMFSMDGEAMIVTHYCAMGNQPRMRCKGESAPGVFLFSRDGGTNIAKGGTYMGELKVTIVDADHIKQEWQSFSGDQPAEHKVSFELTRKKK